MIKMKYIISVLWVWLLFWFSMAYDKFDPVTEQSNDDIVQIYTIKNFND